MRASRSCASRSTSRPCSSSCTRPVPPARSAEPPEQATRLRRVAPPPPLEGGPCPGSEGVGPAAGLLRAELGRFRLRARALGEAVLAQLFPERLARDAEQ